MQSDDSVSCLQQPPRDTACHEAASVYGTLFPSTRSQKSANGSYPDSTEFLSQSHGIAQYSDPVTRWKTGIRLPTQAGAFLFVTTFTTTLRPTQLPNQ